MAIFAVIKNGKVDNTILADSLEIAKLVTNDANCIDITDKNAGIGWMYNSTTGEFTDERPKAEHILIDSVE